MDKLTYESLTEWGKANPQQLQKLCKYFKEIAEIRSSTDEKKVKLSNQYSSTVSGYPSKFIRPTSNNWEDFFIVEGDSAKGSFNTYRYNPTQGVFPIRGMITNCFEKPEATCLQNPEVAGILTIIGGGYGKNFNIDKVRWKKVIACFTGDTRVRTINEDTDGMTFEQLTKYSEDNPSKDIWVYSYDNDRKKAVPGLARDIGIKEYVDRIAVIVFDDGGVVKSTIDHKFLTRDYGYVEAKDLQHGTSIVPLYTKLDKDTNKEKIFDGSKWEGKFHWIASSQLEYFKYNPDKRSSITGINEDYKEYYTNRESIAINFKYLIDSGYNLDQISEELYNNYNDYLHDDIRAIKSRFDNISKYYDTIEEAYQCGMYFNHKVVSVNIIELKEPIPMYCMTVDGYNNFAVCTDSPYDNKSSLFVHNCADADSAGNQIKALLLRLILRFCPQLILAGKYYKAVAPLYYITTGKGKNKQKVYFTDRIELVNYIQKSFSKNNIMTTLDDKKLSPNAIQELLYDNIDYIYELEKVANRYRILPDILEIYLINRDLTPDKICKIIKKKYRFMEQVNIDGLVTCDGIANGVSNTLILDDRMLNECNEIIKILDKNLYKMYKVNGEVCTIFDVMKKYDNYSPANLTRLKGLGEQSGEELAESVILPGDMGNRTLLRYTMDSAMKEIEQIRRFESDKGKLLEGLVVSRIDIAD